MRDRRTLRPSRERGAAIVTAILVVTLAAVIVSGLFYRESVAIRSIENRQSLSQTRWVERAVVDFLGVILRSDNPTFDYAGDTWATPVVNTQFDETMTGGAKIGDEVRNAFIAGAVTDAQSRINVNALLKPDSIELSLPHVQAMTRLMGLLGLPASLVDRMIVRVREARPRVVDGKFVPPRRTRLMQIGDLRDIEGIDDSTLQLLSQHVTVLPDEARTVNINTASAEVIAAMVDGVAMSTVKAFIAGRDRLPAQTPTAIPRLLRIDDKVDTQQVLSVNTQFFLVDGVIRYDRVESRTQTLLRRGGTGPAAQIQTIWQHRN